MNLTGAAVLLIAAIVCGTTAAFAFRESRPRTAGRGLAWLLGLGTLWYLTLAGQYALFSIVAELARERGRVLPAGPLRPFLLFFIAGLAHCYIAELPPERRPRLPVSVMYLPAATLVGVILGFRIVTRQWGLFEPFRIESGPLVGLSFGVLAFNVAVLVVGYWRLTQGTPRSPVWLVVVATETVLVWFSFDRWPDVLARGSGYYDLLSLLIPIPLALWLAYNRTRFLFFDVLIKGGLSAILLVGLVGVAGAMVIALAGKTGNIVSSPDAVPILILCAVPSVTVFLIVRGRLDRWSDRVLLGRPDYAAAYGTLSSNLAHAMDAEAAVALVIRELGDIMRAERVVIGSAADADSPENSRPERSRLVASVVIGEHSFGRLCVTGGPDGQRFLSEDHAFVERVAERLATMLLAFQVREQTQVLRELADRANLRALQAQMHPHFLFNALNLLNTLIRVDPDRARGLLQRLAAVFRYTLDATRRDTVTFGEEIEFVENYLEVAKARFGSRLTVVVDVPDVARRQLIPPMMVQPLVENAIRHGIEPKPGAVSVSVSARIENGRLCVDVTDTGIGFDPDKPPRHDPSDGHSGIGLRNIRERLAARYGTTCSVVSRPERGTTVVFSIPFDPSLQG